MSTCYGANWNLVEIKELTMQALTQRILNIFNFSIRDDRFSNHSRQSAISKQNSEPLRSAYHMKRGPFIWSNQFCLLICSQWWHFADSNVANPCFAYLINVCEKLTLSPFTLWSVSSPSLHFYCFKLCSPLLHSQAH